MFRKFKQIFILTIVAVFIFTSHIASVGATINGSNFFANYIEKSLKTKIHEIEELKKEELKVEEKAKQKITSIIIAEKKAIEKRSKNLSLGEQFCLRMTDDKTYEYCLEQLVMQRINVKKREIETKRKSLDLTNEFCMNMHTEENYNYCKKLLADQKEEEAKCANKKIAGNNIYIDLEKQELYALKNCKLIVHTRVITGKNSTPSPVGKFKIHLARTNHWMQGQWYVEQAYYFKGGVAVHDAKWRHLWEPKHRAVYGSHGCINTPKSAMEIIWKEFQIGDNVSVYYKLPEDIYNEFKDQIDEDKFIDPVKKAKEEKEKAIFNEASTTEEQEEVVENF